MADSFPKSSKRAYQLYKDELATHLELADRVFENPAEMDSAKLHEVGVVFHRLKGSSGFLQLTELESQAAQLETILMSSLENVIERGEEIQELVDELKRLAHELPDE